MAISSATRRRQVRSEVPSRRAAAQVGAEVGGRLPGGGEQRINPADQGRGRRHRVLAAERRRLAAAPVMLPIPATGSLAHLEENVAAASLRLTPEETSPASAGNGVDA